MLHYYSYTCNYFCQNHPHQAPTQTHNCINIKSLLSTAVWLILVCVLPPGQEYLGCFKDQAHPHRALSTLAGLADNRTVESCIHTCKLVHELTYAGLEVGQLWALQLGDLSLKCYLLYVSEASNHLKYIMYIKI